MHAHSGNKQLDDWRMRSRVNGSDKIIDKCCMQNKCIADASFCTFDDGLDRITAAMPTLIKEYILMGPNIWTRKEPEMMAQGDGRIVSM
jgi:hypothetical protein